MTMTLQERVEATNDSACPRVETTVRPSIRDRFWILELRCPFCHRLHTHGGGSIDHPPALGHRLSHCLNHARDYELVSSIEEEPPRDQ